MTKNISSLLLMAAGLLMLTSCLGTEDDETTYFDDTAVTSFSLGTLNTSWQGKAADGVTDSTYYGTYDASRVKFAIDQVSHRIYNADSLPKGVDASAALATVMTKNGGTVILRLRSAGGQDSLAYYQQSDSIDFSQPIGLRVYNQSGTAYREYQVTVNVHRQSGTEFAWQPTEGDLTAVGARRIVDAGTAVYLFGQSGDATVGYRKDGSRWEALAMATTLDADAYRSVIARDGTLYTLSGGSVMSSADGQLWTTVAAAPNLRQLLGSTPARLYALTAEGLAMSQDGGATWQADSLGDDNAMLPTESVSFICQPSKANADTYNLVLIGLREGQTAVWSKVEEDRAGAQAQPWVYYNDDGYNTHRLPLLQHLQVVAYDGKLLATGGDFSQVWVSPDEGLTWSVSDAYALPTAFAPSAAPFALATDSSHHLYASPAGSNSVWTGRLARLAWHTEQTLFTE